MPVLKNIPWLQTACGSTVYQWLIIQLWNSGVTMEMSMPSLRSDWKRSMRSMRCSSDRSIKPRKVRTGKYWQITQTMIITIELTLDNRFNWNILPGFSSPGSTSPHPSQAFHPNPGEVCRTWQQRPGLLEWWMRLIMLVFVRTANEHTLLLSFDTKDTLFLFLSGLVGCSSALVTTNHAVFLHKWTEEGCDYAKFEISFMFVVT